MVTTRSKRGAEQLAEHEEPEAVQQAASDSEDDEAPEEVTLLAGKETVAQRRREEQESRRQLKAAAKERHQRQQSVRAEQQAAGKAGRRGQGKEQADKGDNIEQHGAAGEAVEEAERDEEGEAGSSGQDLDLLPDDVIAAIASTKRTVPTSEQQRLISAQLRRQAAQRPGREAKRQRQEFVERQVGPVKVAVLPKVGDPKASEAARAFLEQRLIAGHKRSRDMLRPTKVCGTFVHGPGSGWD